MKIFLLSFAAGILVGLVYWLLGVRSPAPPAVALLGLLGILIGEQAVPLAKRMLAPATAAGAHAQGSDRMVGDLGPEQVPPAHLP